MIPYAQKRQALRKASPTATAAAAPGDHRDKVLALLAATLGVPRASVQATTPFAEMGMSSLLGVRFLDSVNRAFGLKLGVEILFAHPTAAALAEHVASLAPVPPAPVLRAVEPAPAAEPASGDIAVIGMAGRFPGAPDIDSFWQALAEGRCLIREVPPERWSAAAFYDPGADAAAKGKSISKWAGFLDDIDRFDAAFFNISPREAAAMDPQHRLFLEQAWLALENAGYPAERLKGSATGVYVGASSSGYETMLDPGAKATQSYGLTGNLLSLLASRIAYFLDLRGPSLVVDTACSASLVALDLACQALQRGEIEMALVGGVCLFLDEKPFVAMTRTGMLSPDGRCHTFDAAANGIAVGEAVAAVVLKPLARALADGDRIDAVIKATGTNQDGRSNGITAPNPEAQTALLRAVQARAGIDPATITYVEAHGTGTTLGDPIEVAALRDALGPRPAGEVPCAIGAVKSNIGHTAEAAGIAGLIKTALCLKHGELVPSVNFTTLNPAISVGESGLHVATRREPWRPARGGKRRAGLSSFGLSGTNAHVVLEEAPEAVTLPAAAGSQLLLLSARDDQALKRRALALAAWLQGPGAGADLADVAATLALGRSHFDHRLALVATSVADAATKLAAGSYRHATAPRDAVVPTVETATADAYLAGATPDWPHLWPAARRTLPLPGYPFAGAVHWSARRSLAPTATPHAFADSEAAPVTYRFTAGDPVVRDHVIGGVPVLHASIFLEMARLAASRQRGETVTGLRDIAWEQTIRIAADGVSVRIDAAPAADGVACTMTADDGSTAARGRAVFGPPTLPPPIDADAIKKAVDRHAKRAELDALDRGAVRLGPSFAGFDELWLARDAALSWIGPSAADAGFILPPRLMDAAIQTGAALLARDDGATLRLRYPSSIAAIDIARAMPAEGSLIAARRAGPDSVDITLADAQGVPWMSWTAFEMRPAAAPRPVTTDAAPARTCRITWQAADLQRTPVAPDAVVGDPEIAALFGESVTQASPDDSVALDSLVARLNGGARIIFADLQAQTPLGLLRLVKRLAARGLGTGPLELRVLTRGANRVDGHEGAMQPAAAAIQGLAKAIGREFPSWRIAIVDLDEASPQAVREIALGSPVSGNGEPIAWRGGRPFVRVLEPVAALPSADTLKRHGTYLLVGGMGRVGRELARHLAKTFAARLVLVGRRPLDDERKALLEELTSLGGEAEYHSADATRPAALAAVVAAAEQRFGAIDGVVQAVFDPLFARIDQTDEAAFASSIAPKMAGLVALAEATAHCRLDFFAVFSSIGAYSGFPGNVGQASYCAACCFEEAFAAALDGAGRPVRLIQWGLWENEAFAGDGLRRLIRQGTYPMRAADALTAFERMVGGPDCHLVHASLSDAVWTAMGAAAMPGADFARANAVLRGHGRDSAPVDATLHHAVDAYARALAAKTVQKRGPAATWPALPRHRRLFDAVLDLLQRVPASAPTREELLARAPTLRDPLELLQICVEALPDVIAGEREGTDVLFPGGSMQCVEAIYRNQPVLAACNTMLAAAVAAALPLRILEIGAGTGATADAVLAALPADAAAEYHYTDISPGFVRHARQRRSDPRLRFAVLDIERDPAEQDIADGSIDLVIATNVLHATRDIGETLRHIAKALRPGGLVLINEMTVAEDFATLTFGLLDGWWRATDGARRLPHSPLLDVTGWRSALRAAGFAHVAAAPAPGFTDVAASPQVVLLAAKAGQATAAAPPSRASAKVAPSPKAAAPALREGGPALADIEALVRARVAAGLDLAPAEIDPDRPFGEQGVDSIVAPQIADDIGRAAGVTLRPTDLYNFATVRTLAAHVLGLRPVVEAPQRTESAPLPTVPANAIAIVGMAGRFPDAPDLERFWENIAAGRSAVREIDRFDIAPWYAPERGKPGKTYAKWAATLEDYDRFDPLFFSISPAEAEAMDPQQRLLLEEAWHALEDAGITPRQLDGRRCGVFVGASANSYMAPASPSLQTLGGSMAILSARLSYFLNLKGPTFPVDTGCSSSLVALHLACQSLRLGESEIAIAGGVSCNLLSPPIFTYLSDAGMASPRGLCSTFDDAADGFVPGEGVGLVVLKRLGDALRDGDRIHAVVRATGINQDGKTSGLTAPSATSQTELECEVYRQAEIDPATIGLVEAHGTGTKLGDPIEIAALTDAFAAFTSAKQFCAIGSVKTNMGHAMAAAGIAGLLKAVQAVRHRTLPPSLNFSTPNRHIDFANSPFVVNTASRPWESDQPLRAAISSFGFSGTNAHVVIEQAPDAAPPTAPAETGPWLFVISAKTEASLARRVEDLRRWLAAQPKVAPADLAHTLAARRAHFRFRRAVVAGSLADLAAALGGEPSAATTSSLDDLAKRYIAGEQIDVSAFQGRLVDLPGYPFERERFWNPRDERVVERPSETKPSLRSILESWVTRDHVVQGRQLLPGAAFLEIARAAAQGPAPACSIRDVVWSVPVDVTDGVTDQSLDLERTGDATRCVLRAGEKVHASALVGPSSSARPAAIDLSRIAAACPAVREGGSIYEAAERHGFSYGPGFRVLKRVAIGASEALADLEASPSGGWTLHPALLDGALQAAACIGFGREGQPTYVPFALGSFEAFAPITGSCRVHARLTSESATLLVFDISICATDGTALAMLRGLQARALMPAGSAAPETLLIAPAWRPQPAATRAAAETVIALADAAACRTLASSVRRLVQVEPGPAFARHSADRFTIDPARPEDYRRLLDEAAPGAGAVLVHLWSMTGEAPQEAPTLSAALEASQPDTGLRSFFLAVQAAIQAAQSGVIRALYCTPSTTDGAAAAAFARTVMLESSRLSCSAVTLTSTDLPLLSAEYAAAEAEVAYRDGGRYVRTLAAVSSAAAAPSDAVAAPVYVITGGAGSIGLRVARHLASTRPCRLVLIGRSRLHSAQQTALAEIEAAGADVLYLQADVTSGAALRTALDKARRRFGPIHGVFHAAGVLRDTRIAQMPADAFDAVSAPKIAGAVVLDRLTRDDPLETFVLFSSTAATFGSAGQAAYAAANGFLDGFAEQRRGRGQTVSIAWPLWQAGGMAPPPEVTAELERRMGMLPMPDAAAFAALDAAMSGDAARLVVLHGRADALRRFVAGTVPPAVIAPPAARTVGAELRGEVEAYLKEVIADVTKLAPSRIDREERFEAYGIDSMMIVRMNARLEEELGELPKTLFFEYQTVRDLAGCLMEAHADALARRFVPRAAETAAPVASAPALAAEAVPVSAAEVDDGAIAIIGISGIYPMAADLDQFWRNLAAGRDCIVEIPPERWALEGFYDPDRERPETSYSKWGGFIDGVDLFDARFFNISPREADALDPQARKFLEIAWATMEDAGLTRDTLFRGDADPAARLAGVFVGVMYGDYQLFGPEEAARGNLIAPNAAYWNVANRVSHFLDLHGPSMAIDTACSSSLTAIHTACAALRNGDCTVAFAGGVNLTVHPGKHWILSKSGFASSDGRCRSFGAGGDGYVPGEGIGAVLLKPLVRALADGDRIHAVIRSSSVNHGGRTTGYTVPNPVAQGSLVAAALARKGIAADSISYIEAHGTGTALGDPVEIAGLARAFKGVAAQSVPVGSVKSNIGHLESAAGIAALTKVVLQLRHEKLVPSLHADALNPNLDLAATPFYVQRALTAWPRRDEGRRRAGISSFGAGGANAHVVVEEAPRLPAEAPHDGSPLIVPLSAATAERLVEQARRLAAWLTGEGADADFAAVVRTLQVGREAMRHRAAFRVRNAAELVRQLVAFADGRAAAPVFEVAGWLEGGRVDWDRQAPGVRRAVSLPTYSFAPRRCWVELTAPKAAPPSVVPALSGPQPVTCDPADPLVVQHRVGGRTVLAGAFLLEAARRAGAGVLATPVSGATDVRFLRPVVPDMKPSVAVEADGSFVVSGADQPHVSGRLQTGGDAIPAAFDLAAIRARCRERIEHAAIYEALAAGGVEYGEAYRLIRRLARGDGEVLADLASVPRGDGWPPTLLDAAFQVTFALAVEKGGLLPFTIDRLSVHGALSDAAYVHGLRREAGKAYVRLDLTIIDRDGAVLAAIEGFVARRVASATPTLPLRLLAPVWRALTRPRTVPQGRVVIVADEGARALSNDVAAAWSGDGAEVVASLPSTTAADHVWLVVTPQTDGGEIALVARLAETIRALAALPKSPKVTVLTVGANAVREGEILNAGAAAIAAFAKSAGREHPEFRLRVLDIEPEAPAAVLIALPHEEGEIAWRDGTAWTKRYQPISLPAQATPWRRGGVYVIAGGAGGIGLALSEHLVRVADARVALLGRRPLDATLRGKLAGIAGDVLYLEADVTDAAAIANAMQQVKARFGVIHGAFHLALAMHDARAVTLTEAQIASVMAPKTEGTRNLMAALRDTALDAFVVFSSSNAHTANPGQSAYAAASAAQDAIGLGAAPWPVKVIDWGFWGEVGRVAAPEFHASLARIGVYPIATAEGFATVERLLASPVHQLVPLRISDAVADALGVERPSALDEVAAAVAPRAAAAAAMLAEAAASFGAIDGYAASLLLLAFRDLGALRQPGEAVDLATLAGLGVGPRFARLATAAIDLLQRAGFVTPRGEGWAATEAAVAEADTVRRTLAARRARWIADQPEVAPYLDLLDLCAARIADVLRGTIDANDVLFPGGSPHLVEPIYRGNRVVDHFQAIVADATVAAVRARLADLPTGETLQILEIGAGTGGTTAFVLDALAPFADRIRYVFTDIGAFFLDAARQRFADYPFIEYAPFDIERLPERQGFAANGFDVVIAANVLHATRDIDGTLANVRALCRTGGVLLINEATARQDFNTLTFGLTRGWWLFEDEARRIPHAPLLQAESWLEALAAQGFRGARVLAGGQGALQSVIAAEGDGTAPAPVRAAGPASAPASGKLIDILRRTVAKSLRLSPEEVEPETSFADYGADSIISVDLVREINAALGIDLKTTALFNYSTVATLAGYIEAEFAGQLGIAAEEAPKPVSRVRERSERLREIIRKRREGTMEAPSPEPAPTRTGDDDAAMLDLLQRLQAGKIGVAEALSEAER